MQTKKFKKLKRKKHSELVSRKVTSIIKILSLIDEGKKVTAPSLAEQFECSEKTIYRYIKTISEAEIPIIYDNEKGSYIFAGGFSLKKVVLNSEELSDFIVIKEMVKDLGLPSQSALTKIFDKITTAIKGNAQSKRTIIIDLAEKASTPMVDKTLCVINEAIKKRVKLKMKYYTLRRKKISEREVSPYGAIYHDGFWYMIGKCNLNYDIRTFACDQIKGIELTNERYSYPPDFSLEKFTAQSFGIITDKNTTNVSIKFSAEVVDQVLRKKWHPSQKEEHLPNGDVILSFCVSGIKEVKNWANSWIPHCEILEPSDLRKDIEEELKQALKAYQ